MPKVQSPSSINTYKQCPRKYFYQYIECLPARPSIHLIRGSIAHTVLENFFRKDMQGIHESNYKKMFQSHIQVSLVDEWLKKKNDFCVLDISKERLEEYFDETMMMLFNFTNNFCSKVDRMISSGKSFSESYLALTPIIEKKYE
jgi:hypothetical protein